MKFINVGIENLTFFQTCDAKKRMYEKEVEVEKNKILFRYERKFEVKGNMHGDKIITFILYTWDFYEILQKG